MSTPNKNAPVLAPVAPRAAASRRETVPQVPHALFATFRVEETLGAGAMGVVVRATQLGLGRSVAIKLPTLAGADLIERFIREGRVMARLQHPNLVRVYDAGQEEGRPYIVLEYVRGCSLAGLAAGRMLQPAVASALMIQLLDGLGHAHSHGVLHRDVKTENALVTEEGVLKLSDFGLARSDWDTGLTRAGMIMGTPAYMSPEQARGEPVDARADLYSAAVILFELLAGRLPFQSGSPYEMLEMQCVTPAPPLRGLVQGVPERLADAVARSLAKVAAERFASAEEFGRCLRQAIGERALERAAELLPGLVAGRGEQALVVAGATLLQDQAGSAASAARTEVRPGRQAAAAPASGSRAAAAPPAWSVAGRRVMFAVAGLLTVGLALILAPGRSRPIVAPAGVQPAGPAATASAKRPASADAPPVLQPAPILRRFQLTSTGEEATQVALAAIDRKLLAAWVGKNGRVGVACSDDLGSTWKRPALDGKLLVYPQSPLAMVGRGQRCYLAYIAPGPQGKPWAHVVACQAEASGWQPPHLLGPSLGLGSQVLLVGGPAGYGVDALLAVWETPGEASPAIAWGRPSTGAWQSAARLTRPPGSGRLAAAVTAHGEGFVVWQQDDLALDLAFLMGSSCKGVGRAWSPAKALTVRTMARQQRFPAAASDDKGVYLQWQETSDLGSRLSVGRLSSDGAVVEAAETVEPFSKDQQTQLAACRGRLWSIHQRGVDLDLDLNLNLNCSVRDPKKNTWSKAVSLDRTQKLHPTPGVVAVSPELTWAMWSDRERRALVTRLP